MITWFRRVWHLVNRCRRERELVREMDEHRGSMHDPSKFGDTHRLLEYSRDAWGWNWLDDATQDLRMGIRGLVRAPIFAVTAILILTFGTGLNLTLYQMATVGLLRPPNITSPETLAKFKRRSPGSSSSTMPYQMAKFVERENDVFSAVLLESTATVMWGKELLPSTALFVSANWFTELGGAASQGRVFSEAVDTAQSAPVVVISHQFWRNQLGSDPAVVGSTREINRFPVTVIGVSAREFAGTDIDQPSMWLVIDQREHVFPDSPFLRAWDAENTAMYGRLNPGVAPSLVRERMRSLLAGLRQERPDIVAENEWLEPMMGSVNFMDDRERNGIVGALSLLGTLTTLVLMVAAANVGNLVLSRATGRSRELGVRVALGADRMRIARQLVIETLPIALGGAAAGLLLATWAADTIATIGGIAENISYAPDWTTAVVAIALSVVALLVVGAVPAWKVARTELIAAIKDGGHQVSVTLDRTRLRRFMMAAQVCGSCLILVLAAMMSRTLQRVLSNDLGFDYEQAAVLEPGLGRHGFTAAQAASYWTTVKDRLAQQPETAAMALALAPPLGRRIQETTLDDAPGLEVVGNRIEPAFFDVMKISLLLGRTFQAGDDPKQTVILSRTLAVAMYGSLDVLGRGFPRSKPAATIVGVVGDAHAIRPEAANTAEVYHPLTPDDYIQAVLIVRARNDVTSLPALLGEAARIDSRLLPGIGLMRDSFERRLTGNRIASGIAVGTGLLTLAIACLGIFGVVSYGATLRAKEYGIHIALGAEARSIVRLVVRRVVWPITIGMTIGAVAAGPIGVALSSGPIQLRASDPAAYAGALLLFVTAALTAAILPAIRVLKGDPIQALRQP